MCSAHQMKPNYHSVITLFPFIQQDAIVQLELSVKLKEKVSNNIVLSNHYANYC